MKYDPQTKAVGTQCLRSPNCRVIMSIITLLLLLAASAPRAGAWGIT